MTAAIPFPTWLRPEIIPGLPFRWYGLMYVLAFAVAWVLFNYEAKRRQAPWNEDQSASFFFWAIAGLLVGARLFGTFLYDPNHYYLERPWLVFWPFDEQGRYTGFQGMSFHGGLVGVIVATLIYTRIRKLSWLAFVDILAVSAPLGYTFGRIGNFINGELWGKVTTAPWGMIFPNAGTFSAKEQWVQDAAQAAGIQVSSMKDLVNLPRYPTQLFEAFFEGFLLWLVLWLFVRKRGAFRGFAAAAYLTGYGIARFAIEYFREPDRDMGWIIALGDPKAPTWTFTTLFNFSMGQVLSFFMIAGGLIWMFYGPRIAEALGPKAAEPAVRDASGEARKLRKRIK